MASTSPSLLTPAPGGPTLEPGRLREAIFTFDDMTWAAAQARGMCFPQDRLALAMLEDADLERVMICDRPRSAPVKLARDVLQRPLRFKSNLRHRLWQPLRVRRQDPTSLAGLERAYRRYDRRLEQVARRFGMERPAIITAQPLLAGFAPLRWAGPVTLYATDDLASHRDYRPWHEGLEEAYRRVGASGRRVCTVSAKLLDKIEPTGPAAVVPNGVDPAMWLSPDLPPRWFTGHAAPRLLYVGTLDSRLDAASIVEVARAFPTGSVVLVGPVGEAEALRPMLAEPNVHLHEPVSREGVAALAHAADACLLPHRVTPLTEAMSPLKLYEYLASGTPVVATDLEPVRRAEAPVVRVAPGGDFVSGVREAIARGRLGEPQRRARIETDSWASRSAAVLDLALAR
jgi:teichuronic acid biosynthesis glycosyltransferase TuaH